MLQHVIEKIFKSDFAIRLIRVMDDFRAYLLAKKIDPDQLIKYDAQLYKKWEADFVALGKPGFEQRYRNVLNRTRRAVMVKK